MNSKRESLARQPGGANLWTSIVTAWLIAGTIDIVIAISYYPLTVGVTPIRILQGIASGLLGQRAFSGGLGTAGLGLICHFTIAFLWTGFFFLAYPYIGALARHRVLTAALYGVLVSVIMTFVVLPLSRVAVRPFNLRAFAIATIILMFSIGLPLSIVAGKQHAA